MRKRPLVRFSTQCKVNLQIRARNPGRTFFEPFQGKMFQSGIRSENEEKNNRDPAPIHRAAGDSEENLEIFEGELDMVGNPD